MNANNYYIVPVTTRRWHTSSCYTRRQCQLRDDARDTVLDLQFCVFFDGNFLHVRMVLFHEPITNTICTRLDESIAALPTSSLASPDISFFIRPVFDERIGEIGIVMVASRQGSAVSRRWAHRLHYYDVLSTSNCACNARSRSLLLSNAASAATAWLLLEISIWFLSSSSALAVRSNCASLSSAAS